jgi:hypothetical protein
MIEFLEFSETHRITMKAIRFEGLRSDQIAPLKSLDIAVEDAEFGWIVHSEIG